MEISPFILEKDIEAFVIEASSFPEGVDLAHEKLHNLFINKKDWQFYGISYMLPDGSIRYLAGASPREGVDVKNVSLNTFTIKKGKYNSVLLQNFMSDESIIAPTFQALLKDSELDPNGYCLEIFENKGQDMRCLVKLNDTMELF
jgi:hypothetical protein